MIQTIINIPTFIPPHKYTLYFDVYSYLLLLLLVFIFINIDFFFFIILFI